MAPRHEDDGRRAARATGGSGAVPSSGLGKQAAQQSAGAARGPISGPAARSAGALGAGPGGWNCKLRRAVAFCAAPVWRPICISATCRLSARAAARLATLGGAFVLTAPPAVRTSWPPEASGRLRYGKTGGAACATTFANRRAHPHGSRWLAASGQRLTVKRRRAARARQDSAPLARRLALSPRNSARFRHLSLGRRAVGGLAARSRRRRPPLLCASAGRRCRGLAGPSRAGARETKVSGGQRGVPSRLHRILAASSPTASELPARRWQNTFAFASDQKHCRANRAANGSQLSGLTN